MNRLGSRTFWIRLAALGLAGWMGTAAWAEPRAAQVAGEFYPDDPQGLRELIQELLDRQPEPETSQKPRVLLVPHAGYQYSGLVAAAGFRQLPGHAYDGVVVVGFTHRFPFAGVSVDTREAYQTPLGEFPIDQEAAAVLQAYPGIDHMEEAHQSGEHSLEVELPFLQVALGLSRVVPVVMGSADLEDAEHLADALAGLSRLGDYLFVFSTDLSHYHPYSEAETIDEGTINAILFETPQAVDRLFRRGQVEACGRGPILTGLLLAARLGYPRPELLSYANSGDTTGDPARVVGYAAIAAYDRPAPSHGRISAEAGQALVAAARNAVSMAFERSVMEAPIAKYPELAAASGVFVTLRKHGQLRGCIGRIQTDQPLRASIGPVALDAALRDHRFPPVSADELDELEVEVSVLTPPVRIQHAREIVAGRDGVILEHEGRSGVFLPTVWEETGWTRTEFLRELASQKAGLPPDAWPRAALSVFQDQVFNESR